MPPRIKTAVVIQRLVDVEELPGYVYCHIHGEVHIDHGDPYCEGLSQEYGFDCSYEHRRLYIEVQPD